MRRKALPGFSGNAELTLAQCCVNIPEHGPASVQYWNRLVFYVDYQHNVVSLQTDIYLFVALAWVNVGLMLGQRLRRWPNMEPTFDHLLMLFSYSGLLTCFLAVRRQCPVV